MVLQNTAVTIGQNSYETDGDGETEADVQRCSVKKLLWKPRKIHKKEPVPESLFNIVPAIQSATLLKKRLHHSYFLYVLQNFPKRLFDRTFSGYCF